MTSSRIREPHRVVKKYDKRAESEMVGYTKEFMQLFR